MTSSRKNSKLKNKAYAHAYARELQDLMLATQIRVLREQRNLTQAQLAALADMKQARISLLESGSYSQWSLATLRALAEALDVGLAVRFTSFCKLVDRLEHESRELLKVDDRTHELAQAITSSATTITLEVQSSRAPLPIEWVTSGVNTSNEHATAVMH